MSIVLDIDVVIWEEGRQVAGQLGSHRSLPHRVLQEEAVTFKQDRDCFSQPILDFRLVHDRAAHICISVLHRP